MRFHATAAKAVFAFVLHALLAGTCLAQAPAATASGPWPQKPITLLLGFPPGGGTDGPSRQIADKLRASLGVPVVVENRPGANQMTAIRALLAAPPDGYTLLVGTGSSLAQNPALNASLGYDPLKDFTPIARFGVSSSAIIVGPSMQAKTLPEFIEHVKANPGKVTFASGGIGAAGHLSMELFAKRLGLEMRHVPYKGDGPAMIDVAEGRVDAMMASYNSLPPFAGRVRRLASTAATVLPYATDVPTLAQAGLPELAMLDPYTFFGIVGPANLPQDIVNKVNAAVNEATRSPDLASFFRERLYTEPVSESPAQFRTYVEQQFAKWRPFRGQIAGLQ
jgi:tripartite-type tricarboxylate transporter receptor subunit TctC